MAWKRFAARRADSFDVEARPKCWILCGDPDRTPAGVTDPILLATDGHHRSRPDGHGVGAERQGLGEGGRDTEPSGDDARDIARPFRIEHLLDSFDPSQM